MTVNTSVARSVEPNHGNSAADPSDFSEGKTSAKSFAEYSECVPTTESVTMDYRKQDKGRTMIATGTTHETCMNGHEPEHIEIRPNGARVCGKCRDHYAARNRKHSTRKVINDNDSNIR